MKPKLEKNLQKLDLIDKLHKLAKEKNKDIYYTIAKQLKIPKRKETKVNLAKLENLNIVLDGDIIIIPGKLLATGVLNKNITIYAENFSKNASLKLNHKVKKLKDLLTDKIDYKKTKIIK
jgi:large subunit ribosomal protein L18e